MATRVLTAFFICPQIGFGSGVVAELCRPDQRARKLGWWILMTILGTPTGPFLMGFVVEHAGVQWIFWIFAIFNFLQAVGYILFGEETMYSPPDEIEGLEVHNAISGIRRFIPRRITVRPLRPRAVIAPFVIGARPRVLIPALATAITFCYANIVFVVKMPILSGEKFHLGPQQIGLQFLSVVIGCVPGEQLAGPGSDYFMKFLAKRKTAIHAADRLWLSHVGFATIIAGLLVWGFQLEHSTTRNITPRVGVAIASFGNQIQSTILTTYAVDSHREDSAAIGVFFNVVRLVYGFVSLTPKFSAGCVAHWLIVSWQIGPFYFPYMFASLGFAGTAGVLCAIVVVGGMVPAVGVQVATSWYRG